MTDELYLYTIIGNIIYILSKQKQSITKKGIYDFLCLLEKSLPIPGYSDSSIDSFCLEYCFLVKQEGDNIIINTDNRSYDDTLKCFKCEFNQDLDLIKKIEEAQKQILSDNYKNNLFTNLKTLMAPCENKPPTQPPKIYKTNVSISDETIKALVKKGMW